MFRRVAPLLAACLLLFSAPPLLAQAKPPPAEAPAFTAAEVDALIETIENPERRAKLVDQLHLLKAAGESRGSSGLIADGLGATLLDVLSGQVARVSQGLAAGGRALLAAPAAIEGLVARASEPQMRRDLLEIAVKLGLVLASALLARRVAERLLARPRRAVEARRAESVWVRIPLVMLCAVMVLVPIAMFAAAAYGVLLLAEPTPVTRLIALTVVNAIVTVSVIRGIARLLLAPDAPSLRLLRIGDETAHYLDIWISRLATVVVYGYLFTQAATLLGLPAYAYQLLLRAIGLFVAGLVIVIILQNRAPLAGLLRGRAPDPDVGSGAADKASSRLGTLRHRVADVWHVLAIGYVVATYVIWALDVPGGLEYLLRALILSAAVLAILRGLIVLIRRVTMRGFALSVDLKLRYPGLEKRVNRYLPVLERITLVVLYALAALWLLEVWGIESFGWLSSELGGRIVGSIITIAVVVAVSAMVLEIVNALVERYLAKQDSAMTARRRSPRMRTLLPLLRNVFRVLVGAMLTLMVLSELGVDIVPLLAGAGVVGLAIGFGAQTLVKDVITGFFILAEDTISVGDVVDLGGNSGVVEVITLRTIRLRDLAGAVYTIPFSAVTTVKNLTKDFAFARFDVGISYQSDVDRAIELMRKAAESMRADETLRHSILDELEVLGLNQFGDSAIMLLARLKTRAGEQWTVTREFNRRLKRLFDEGSIEIPFPQRTVRLVADQPVSTTKPRGGGAGETGATDDEMDGGAVHLPNEPA